jgi:hypothetical protein
VKNFLFSTVPIPAIELDKPPVQWISIEIYLEVKQPGREASHFPSSSGHIYIYRERERERERETILSLFLAVLLRLVFLVYGRIILKRKR